MKKAAKIGVSVGSVLVVGLVIATTVNLWIKKLVDIQLTQNIATADSLVITYSDIRVAAFRGRAWIEDVYFRSKTTSWEDTEGPIAEARVDMLSLDGINYFNWLIRRQLNLRGLTIVNPKFHMRFLHEEEQVQDGDVLQEKLEKQRDQRLENILSIARIFIDDATLSRLTIDHAKVYAESLNDSLRVSVPEFTMSIYDLGYNIKDSLPHYNDSVFHFLLRDVEVNIPKVNMALQVDELSAEPNGVVQVNDVQIETCIDPKQKDVVQVGVDKIAIGGFNVAKFNSIKQMDVKNIHLYHPYAKLKVNELNQKNKPKQTDSVSSLSTRERVQIEVDVINQKMAEANLGVITEFITGLTVDTILLHDASLDVQSVSTKLSLNADRLSLALYGVGWSLIDKIPYHYNDSVYQFYLGNVDVVTPDGILAISAQNIRYDNGGAFSLGKTHIHHIVNKWKLGHMMGDVPVSLVDMWVDSVRTSSKNIVKEVYTLEDGFFLDTLYADVRSMSVFRDARYTVKEPYKLPQTYLMQLKYPFVVNCVRAKVKSLTVNMALTKENIGQLNLGPMDFTISNVTPIPNSVIAVKGNTRMGKGSVDAIFNMTVNPACDWNIKLNGKNVDAHHLDKMVYPIVGMKIGCDVHTIKAEYAGDTATASGTYCMTYDNVDIFADKNSNSPIKVVRNLSGLINSAGKTLVNKSNPTAKSKEPVAYQVKWKNDPWVNPAMFYVGPVIDGCIKTMLPGLFLNQRVKDDDKSGIQSLE